MYTYYYYRNMNKILNAIINLIISLLELYGDWKNELIWNFYSNYNLNWATFILISNKITFPVSLEVLSTLLLWVMCEIIFFFFFQIFWLIDSPTKMSVKPSILILETLFLTYTLIKDRAIISHYQYSEICVCVRYLYLILCISVIYFQWDIIEICFVSDNIILHYKVF